MSNQRIAVLGLTGLLLLGGLPTAAADARPRACTRAITAGS